MMVIIWQSLEAIILGFIKDLMENCTQKEMVTCICLHERVSVCWLVFLTL